MVPPRSHLTARLLAPAAGVALLAALLGACAPAPGAAATVNGDVIGENEVAAAVADLTHYGLTTTPTDVLGLLVVAPTTIDVAADAGFGFSDDDARAALTNVAAQNQIEEIEVSDATIEVVRSLLAQSALAEDADAQSDLTEQIAGLDVTTSPRYGTWDGSAPAIVANQPDWIIAATADAA